jgi:hypothetical protein
MQIGYGDATSGLGLPTTHKANFGHTASKNLLSQVIKMVRILRQAG